MDILKRINYYLEEQEESEGEKKKRKRIKERKEEQAKAIRRRLEAMRDRIETTHDAATAKGLPGFGG